MVQNVQHLLYNDTRAAASVQDTAAEVEPNISAEIYRIVRRVDFNAATTALGRLREAHVHLDVIGGFNREVEKRRPLLPPELGSRESRAIAAIKFDMACVAVGCTRKAMKELRETNPIRCSKIVGPFNRIRREGLEVLSYTTAMGSPAALMVWPWMTVHSITGFTLHRQSAVFITAVTASSSGQPRIIIGEGYRGSSTYYRLPGGGDGGACIEIWEFLRREGIQWRHGNGHRPECQHYPLPGAHRGLPTLGWSGCVLRQRWRWGQYYWPRTARFPPIRGYADVLEQAEKEQAEKERMEREAFEQTRRERMESTDNRKVAGQ
ncbi:hypothetical protein V493_04505 [Pseudogymnoascus sp. VKM F-4281 (FW-2241)]|nr:hypothetical protein V493_04505 [Pseudogymnoascus sp. VKM F-4281 (FW-2241)]